jgi:hypothetical protein
MTAMVAMTDDNMVKSLPGSARQGATEVLVRPCERGGRSPPDQ